jgi:thymidylate synthase (FAD)
MPHNPELTPKKHKFKILFGQIPLTHFKDYRKSIKVQLVEPEPKEKMMKRIYGFVNSTWADNIEELEGTEEQQLDALNQMLSGKALQLGLETVNLTFLISGITRVDTHQIVRQRIGVTFSQQCTGDRFLHHNDVLVEQIFNQDELLLNEYINATLECKNLYAEMIDAEISIQAAREILPHNLETFIWMHTNLLTLLQFHAKRIEDGSQTWTMNEIAQQMADETIKAYPELFGVFEKNKKKFTFQKEASKDRENTFSTSLYLPRENDFDYNERDFLYQRGKQAMHAINDPIEDKYFWGYVELKKETFDMIKMRYDRFNLDVEQADWSNEEIKTQAESLNQDLLDSIK